MTMLAAIDTKPAAGVIATRPTTAPMQAPIADGFLPRTQSMNIHAIIAAAEAVLVVAKARTAVGEAARAEPALKPNHPNHSMPVPRITKGMWAGTCVSPSRWLCRRPSTQRAGQGGQPRGHVDDRAAGEVEHAPLPEEALRVPGPVRQRRVDEEREQRHEDQVGAEPHALGKRAGDQRRRDDRELQLEEREQQHRNRRRQARIRRVADAAEHQVGERVADDALEAVAEGEAEPHRDPQHADHPERDEALEHRRDDVLRRHHAAVEERQARRHEQHHAGRRQHPGDVAGDQPLDRHRRGRRPQRQHQHRQERDDGQRHEHGTFRHERDRLSKEHGSRRVGHQHGHLWPRPSQKQNRTSKCDSCV